MKRTLSALLCTSMMVAMLAACGTPATPEKPADPGTETPPPATKELNIGAAIYKFDDTFMTGVRNAMTAAATEFGVKVDIADSQNAQPTQNDQVDSFITKGVHALAINAVDRTAAGPIADKAKAAGLPIVFLNREPEEAVMNSYDKLWYVGAKAEESGTMSGEIIADYFKANPTADKNGDGVIQYIMLTGEPGHQDATLRTEYSIKAIEAAGYKVEKLAEDTAMWDKPKATDKMSGFISKFGVDKIEAVLGNNDDMALGAIEALKAQGYNTGDAAKFVPVVGVDATSAALESMEKGELLGTVLNDAKNQGKATMAIAAKAAAGEAITTESIGYEVTDTKFVWVPYVKVTAANYKEFK